LRAEVRDYLVAEGLAVPKPPVWGKDNDLTKWALTNLKYFPLVTNTMWKYF